MRALSMLVRLYRYRSAAEIFKVSLDASRRVSGEGVNSALRIALSGQSGAHDAYRLYG